MDWITKYWIEWIFGILGGVLIWLFRSLNKKIKEEKAEQEAIKAGLQALLRAQMVSDYNRYMEKGFAPIYARDNFQNCYVQYEKLGENGVINDIHTRFMALPTEGGKHD